MVSSVLFSTIEGMSFYILLTALSYKQKKPNFLILFLLSLFYGFCLHFIDKTVAFGIHTLFVLFFIMITGTVFLHLDLVLCTIYSLIALLINGVLNFIVILFFLFVLHITPDILVSSPSPSVWDVVATQGLFFICSILLYKKKAPLITKNILSQKHSIILIYILSLAIILFFQIAVLSVYIQHTDLTPYIFLVISFIFISIITYGLYVRAIDFISKEKQLEEKTVYISYIQELVTHLRAQRHEFINHLNALYGLVQIQDISRLDKAKRYIEELDFSVKTTSHLLAIEDPILSGLLHTKIAIAEQKNIQVDIDITEDFSQTKLALPEISVIIGNLLDNAIEFSENLEAEERYIYIQIYGDHSQIYISIGNNHGEHRLSEELRTRIFEKGFSTKTSESGTRGYGLYNVRQILEKHGGQIHVSYEDELVYFHIQLPKTQ